MKFPRCRLCGEEHRLGGDHVFPDTPSRAAPKSLAKKAINPARQREAGAINAVVDGRTPNRRARADYNEYMRGYMARRRAARRDRAGAA